jgi:hypothetical protein
MKTLTLGKLQENKNGPCVSIILPTHETSPDRAVDRIEMKKLIEKTGKILRSKKDANGSVTVLKDNGFKGPRTFKRLGRFCT